MFTLLDSLINLILSFFNKKQANSSEQHYRKPYQMLKGAYEKLALEYEKKINDSRHLLRGSSWKDPTGKEAFIKSTYDGKTPYYLWYALGDYSPSSENFIEIQHFFWRNGPCEGAEILLSHSRDPRVGLTLGIHFPERYTGELKISGKEFPLYQIGYPSFPGSGGEPFVCFLEIYKNK